MSMKILAKLYKNPRARLTLSVRAIEANKLKQPILGNDNNDVCV